jgi:hypothetical protein
MGIKRILLKLVDDIPEDTLLSKTNRFNFWLSTYQAIGFASVLDNGIEISMGFDLLENYLWFTLCMNLFQYLILSYIDKLKYKSLIRDCLVL